MINLLLLTSTLQLLQFTAYIVLPFLLFYLCDVVCVALTMAIIGTEHLYMYVIYKFQLMEAQ